MIVRIDLEVNYDEQTLMNRKIAILYSRGFKGSVIIAPFFKTEKDTYVFIGYIFYVNKNSFVDLSVSKNKYLLDVTASGYYQPFGDMLPYKTVKSFHTALSIGKQIVRNNLKISFDQVSL